MKNIAKYILCGLSVVLMAACGDMYEIHEKYLKMGEETYLGAVQELKVLSGLNRVQLQWKLNADPRISKCEITWEGGEEPVIMDVPANRDIKDVMTKTIELPEGKYIFNVKTRSESNKESLVQTVAGEVYGPTYQAGLSAQSIKSISATLSGITIKWSSIEGCTKTLLTYTINNGEEKTVTILPDQTTLTLPDAVPGTQFKLVSYFKPSDDFFEEIPTLEKVMDFPAYYVVSKAEWDAIHDQYADLDRTGWTVEASTEEVSGETSDAKPHNGQAVSLLDGDLTTFWHSQWKGDGAYPPLPHTIIFDMQDTKEILSIELARRQGNGDTKTVVFSIGDDKENWTELGQLEFSSDKEQNAQIVLLPEPAEGRYFRTVVTDSNNGVNASIAEIMFTIGKKE